MRGRKPKPNRLKAAEGDASNIGVRKLQERIDNEAPARSGLPPCPRHLKGRARSAWKFWVEELEIMGLDKRPDAMTLEGACLNYARAVDADLILDREGLIVEISSIDEKTGEKTVLKIARHPANVISHQAWSQVRSFCSEFGFTPVSRTRLSIEKTNKPDDLAAILAGPRAKADATVQ